MLDRVRSHSREITHDLEPRTMTLHISLSAETEARLIRHAEASGKDVAAIVVEAVEEKLNAPACLSDLLAPIHEATRREGMNDADIDTLIDQARNEVHDQRRHTA